MIDFETWWNSSSADEFRRLNDDMDGRVVLPVWDAAIRATLSSQKATSAAPSPEATQPPQAEAPSEREAFEQHYKPATWESECAKLGMPVPMNKVGHYYFRDDEIRWQAWQARAALATQQAVFTKADMNAEYARGSADGWNAACVEEPPLRRQATRATPVYQLQKADGSWVDQEKHSYEYNFKNGVKSLRILYTAPGQVERDREDTDYLCKLVDAIGKDVLGVLKQYGDAQAAIGLMASRIKDSIRDARSSEGGGK